MPRSKHLRGSCSWGGGSARSPPFRAPRAAFRGFLLVPLSLVVLQAAPCSSSSRIPRPPLAMQAPHLLGAGGPGRGLRLSLRGGSSTEDSFRRSPTPPYGWDGEEEDEEPGMLGKRDIPDDPERVGDVLGDDDATQWGPRDVNRDGNEIGHDDDEQAAPRVIDRGTLGGGAMHTQKEKDLRQRIGGNVFSSALDNWLHDVGTEELVNKEQGWYKGTTEELRAEIRDKSAELRRWHRDFGEHQQAQATRKILEGERLAELRRAKVQAQERELTRACAVEGDTVGGLGELRKANVHAPEWDPALGMGEAAKKVLGVDPQMLEGADDDEEEQEGGLAQLMDKGMLGEGEGEEDLIDSVDKMRAKYRGWSMEEMNAELERLTERTNTVYVPSQCESLREAIQAAREEGFKVAVAAGDYQWTDRQMVGGAGPQTDQQLHVRAGGEEGEKEPEASEVRLWGRWCLCANSWGSMEGVTCVHAAGQGAEAVFLVLGGTVAFPWIFMECQVRCGGGIGVLEAQRAFVQATGCVVGGVDAGTRAVYGVYQGDQSQCIMQACTLGYCDIAAVRATADAVSVIDRCNVESNGRGAMLCASAKVLVRNASFVNNSVAAFDPVGGGDDDDPEAQAVRCDVVVQGSRCDGCVWNEGLLPGGLFERDNSWVDSGGGGEVDEAAAVRQEFNSEIIFSGADPLAPEVEERGGRVSRRPPDDLIEVPGEGLSVEALQFMIDRNGCEAVQACYEVVNADPAVLPLLVVPNSSGFTIVNTSDANRTVCGWVRNERHEVILCPACSCPGRVRAGLFGRLRCQACRAVFPRNDTAAAVTLRGVEAGLEEKLREVTDLDALKMNPETHVLVPLPGGKLALMERPPNRTAILKPAINGSGSILGALSGALSGVEGEGAGEEDGQQGGGQKKGGRHGGRFEKIRLGDRSWGGDVAQILEEGAPWTGDVRAQFQSLVAERRDQDARARRNDSEARGAAGAGGLGGKGGMGGGKGFKRPAKPEGPEVPEEWRQRDENKERYKVMCANTSTGDPLMDGILRKQGVVMGGGVPLNGSFVADPPPGLLDDLLGEAKPQPSPFAESKGGTRKGPSGKEAEQIELPPAAGPGGGEGHMEIDTRGSQFEKLASLQRARLSDVGEQPMYGDTEDSGPISGDAEDSGPISDEEASADTKADTKRKINEFRRKLSDGATGDACLEGLYTDERVRTEEGATPMTKEQQVALDKYASRMSKVQDELDREEAVERARRRVEKEEEEDSVPSGEYFENQGGRKARGEYEAYKPTNTIQKATVVEEEEEAEVQRQLLDSMTGQIKDTEHFFRALTDGADVTSGRKDGDLGKELRARALELVQMRDEIDSQWPAWLESNKEEAQSLKRWSRALYKEIWVYCESGAFEERAKVDTKGLVSRLKELGVDESASSVEFQ